MSILGRDFIDAAEKCLDDSFESANRSAISRAYYGFYHEVCNLLTCCPPTTHEGVIRYLLEDHRRKLEPFEIIDLTQLGTLLKQQKAKRKLADYDLAETVRKVDAEQSISTVKRMIKKIDALKPKAA